MREESSGFEGKAPGKFFSVVRAAVIACVVAACSSPEPDFYTLKPVAGEAVTQPRHVIEVRRPGLAGYLDRSSIVLLGDSYRLHVSSAVRWAEPLSDMIGRVLAENLAQRLPGSTVFAEGGAVAADADLDVDLNVQRFDAGADNQVQFVAEMVIEAGHQAIRARHLDLRAPLSGAGAGALAATMSTLLGQAADDIARTVGRTS